MSRRGWWNMACWNGLSRDQQTRLIEWGNLPLGYQPEGGPDACQNGAEVQIETQTDAAPGPRFYCRTCAIKFLQGRPTRPGVVSARNDYRVTGHGGLLSMHPKNYEAMCDEIDRLRQVLADLEEAVGPADPADVEEARRILEELDVPPPAA